MEPQLQHCPAQPVPVFHHHRIEIARSVCRAVRRYALSTRVNQVQKRHGVREAGRIWNRLHQASFFWVTLARETRRDSVRARDEDLFVR